MINCRFCNDKKTLICDICNGLGEHDCEECDNGIAECECLGQDESCLYCNGTNEVDCDICDANGVTQCDECDGEGIIKCEACPEYRDISMNDYQAFAKSTVQYDPATANTYTILGLCGEAGEVANLHKKLMRGDFRDETDGEYFYRAKMRDELGDVLWYIAMVAQEHKLNLAEIAQRNIIKLKDRVARDAIKGSGDER